jgi:hypothetical protein|tara:strand:+ start:467 stop:586 length:120 start_codon:yes stop_codon:yes gene_type:complete
MSKTVTNIAASRPMEREPNITDQIPRLAAGFGLLALDPQ